MSSRRTSRMKTYGVTHEYTERAKLIPFTLVKYEHFKLFRPVGSIKAFRKRSLVFSERRKNRLRKCLTFLMNIKVMTRNLRVQPSGCHSIHAYFFTCNLPSERDLLPNMKLRVTLNIRNPRITIIYHNFSIV